MFSRLTLKTDFTENFIIIKISIESMETHERFTSFIIKQATVTTEEITSWGKLEGQSLLDKAYKIEFQIQYDETILKDGSSVKETFNKKGKLDQLINKFKQVIIKNALVKWGKTQTDPILRSFFLELANDVSDLNYDEFQIKYHEEEKE